MQPRELKKKVRRCNQPPPIFPLFSAALRPVPALATSRSASPAARSAREVLGAQDMTAAVSGDAAMPDAQAPAAVPPPAKKMRLVLDDGTVILGGGAVLRPAAAHEAGLLTEAHLLRAQALLCEEHAKLPEEGPLKSLSAGSKRSADTTLEVGPPPAGAGWAACMAAAPGCWGAQLGHPAQGNGGCGGVAARCTGIWGAGPPPGLP